MHKSNFEIDSLSPNSYIDIGEFLYNNLIEIVDERKPIIFLCIGTDRCTGDSLGPIVGYKLKSYTKDISNKFFYIYGSLESPVHANNLSDIINKIQSNFIDPYIIAIDSSLGKTSNIGKVFIDKKPVFPGLALNKDLPPIGDLSITGIVNISGNYDFLILQNTRLYTVMSLADSISKGIFYTINKIYKNPNILSL